MLLRIERLRYELLDSLGTSQAYVTSHVPFKGSCQFNESKLQSDKSNSCGEFCLYYIVHRLHNLDLTFQEFMDDFFSLDTEVNETNVQNFVKTVLQDGE